MNKSDWMIWNYENYIDLLAWIRGEINARLIFKRNTEKDSEFDFRTFLFYNWKIEIKCLNLLLNFQVT